MTTQDKSKRSFLKPRLKQAYNECSQEVQEYFEHIPKLLDEFPIEVCLAYVFSRLELGQNMALYCGAVKIYRVDSKLARKAVDKQHMTREKFVEFYEVIFEIPLPNTARKDLEKAEKTRDSIMHGKMADGDDIRKAIACVLKYAEEVNKELHEKHQLKPFGNLRGFAGRLKKLDKQTSLFVLEGMGFPPLGRKNRKKIKNKTTT